MLAQDRIDCWDFSPVIDLVYALSAGQDHNVNSQGSQDESKTAAITKPSSVTDFSNQEGQVLQLGNFDKIWTYLGQPLDVPPPIITPPLNSNILDKVTREARGKNAEGRGVHWQDDIDEGDMKNMMRQSTVMLAADCVKMMNPQSKEQKERTIEKQERRKQRKELRREERKASKATKHTQGDSSPGTSETDGDITAREVVRLSNVRKTIIEQILHGNSAKQAPFVQTRYFLRSSTRDRNRDLPTVEISEPKSPVVVTALTSVVPKASPPVDYVALATVKKQKLLSKLYDNFINERQYLKNVSLIQHCASGLKGMGDGIHVFVDISNILIGFHDALKVVRGIPISSRVTRQPLSFHNLSLILERGRPAAKRVLVGSDNFESIQEAKLIGYETNILDRVHKAKELTARQRKFQKGSGLSGQSSGSETNANVLYGPEKWVEQAVDEILHLKILESVVDATEPSTIVLASGDAAEAEYSDGFLKMVERAMSKGWKVELLSFSRNISWAYKKKEFRSKWGEKFTIIELDEYVEELLGEGVPGLKPLSNVALSNFASSNLTPSTVCLSKSV